jgi:nucleotide-binding universal stress UspA family protein
VRDVVTDMGSGRPILVGVDGSDPAFAAVRWAAAEAGLRGAALRLVFAFAGMSAPGLPGREFGFREGVLKEAEGWLARAAEQVPQGVEVTTEVLDGHPVPRLVAEASEAQLAVVGDRGRGGLVGLLVGSVAAAVATHATCPVVVVHGTDRPAVGPVVVGVDGSPVSEDALAFAFDAAAARRVPLVAVHSYEPPFFHPDSAIVVDWEAVHTEEQEVLAERLAGWGERYPDVPVERVVVQGVPAATLVEQSETAQLVVVGSHGHGSLAGLILGSVSRAVLHRARCPVAVVRGAEGSR